jgi:hypothetical protein
MERGFRFTPESIRLAAALNDATEAWKANTSLDVGALAKAIGRTDAWLRKVLEAKLHLHADVLGELTRRTKDTRVVEELARQCGGFFCKLPPSAQAGGNLMELIRECSEVFSAASEALADGRVTREELLRYRREMSEAQAKMVEIDRQMEELLLAGPTRPGSMAEAERHPANVRTLRAGR